MAMNRYIKQWLPLLLLILAGVGCTDEQLINKQDFSKGQTVRVDLNLKIPKEETPKASSTRSTGSGAGFSVALQPDENIETRSDGTTSLYNLWVFQFDQAGNALVRKQISTASVGVNDMVTLSVELVVGTNQTLYIVVLGQTLTTDLSQVMTLNGLENYPFEYLTTKDGMTVSRIEKEEDVPFAGKTTGVEVLLPQRNDGRGFVKYNTPEGFTGGVEIKRIMSKIEIECDYKTDGFTFSGAQLNNVASTFGVNPDNASPSLRYESLNPTTAVGNGKHTFTWFVAPNMQGTVEDIATEQERNSQNNKVPKKATHICLWATNTNSGYFALYEVYVGKNTTSNFDVKANNFYHMNTVMDIDPASIQKDDERVIYPYSIKENIELKSKDDGDAFDLDAHYDFRPLTITGSGKKYTVAILNADDSPASENSWLKISSTSNYTDAYRNNDLGLTASATIKIPAQVHFYLYADEYVKPGAQKRSLKVKVTSTDLEGQSPVAKVFTLQQRPIINVGYWGGTLGDGDTRYSSLLGMEQITEYAQRYQSSTTTIDSNGLPWGYNGIVTGYTNKDTGKDNTKKLAENPNNLPIGNGAVNGYNIQPLKNLDGSPILSQYTYYNAYAARYCYDKNRDENGNGKIDEEELKWYLPTVNQLDGIWIQSETTLQNARQASVEKDDKLINIFNMNMGRPDSYDKDNKIRILCVREIKTDER